MTMLKVKLKSSAVQRVMAKRNMSQNVLAMRVGISSGYISQLMCGTRHASPMVRQKMLDSLGLSFDEVFTIEGDQDEVPAGR
jgi:transcriptional regulator with XRE-family HTH domain